MAVSEHQRIFAKMDRMEIAEAKKKADLDVAVSQTECKKLEYECKKGEYEWKKSEHELKILERRQLSDEPENPEPSFMHR